MTLYTIDEARSVFVHSAVTLLEGVSTPTIRLGRLLGGHRSHTNLTPGESHLVYLHWALLADLAASANAWIVAEELEGLLSFIEVEGVAGAASTIRDMLPTQVVDDSAALAA